MSNLKLPTMTYDNLSTILKENVSKKLAHETYGFKHDDGTISIVHHNTVIAEFSQGGSKLFIANGGWGSSTTRTRLNKVLNDNGIEWGVTQKNFVQVLIRYGIEIESYNRFQYAIFWDGKLADFNGVNAE